MPAPLCRRYDYLLLCFAAILFATGLLIIWPNLPHPMQSLTLEGPDDLTGLIAGRESHFNVCLFNPSDRPMRFIGFEDV